MKEEKTCTRKQCNIGMGFFTFLLVICMIIDLKTQILNLNTQIIVCVLMIMMFDRENNQRVVLERLKELKE